MNVTKVMHMNFLSSTIKIFVFKFTLCLYHNLNVQTKINVNMCYVNGGFCDIDGEFYEIL